MTLAKIGFVGAGIMGSGIASCLLQAGHEVTVIAHRNRTPIEALLAAGAKEAQSYETLLAASDCIILCVSNSSVVERVVEAMMPFLHSGLLVIDTGTSNPASTVALAKSLESIGVTFVEAPVTGGIKQAAAGELGALVGSDEAAFDRAEPILSTFCKTIHHFGPVGSGNSAKLLNNFMVLGIAALVTEAFAKADQADIDWQKLYDVVICGSADSGVLRRIIGSAVKGDFKGYVFDVKGSLKDISYFCDLSETMGGTSALARAVQEVYATAVADGHGERLLSELLAPDLRSVE